MVDLHTQQRITPYNVVESQDIINPIDVATINQQSLIEGGNIVLPTNSDVDLKIAQHCPILEDTRNSKTEIITANAPFSELNDGQLIILQFHYNSQGPAKLNLTLSNGQTTGPKPIIVNLNNGSFTLDTDIVKANTSIALFYVSVIDTWRTLGIINPIDASQYYTKKESEARFAGKPFIVTFAETAGELVADKTFAATLAAYNGGAAVYFLIDGAAFPAAHMGNSSFVGVFHYANLLLEVYLDDENKAGKNTYTLLTSGGLKTINSESLEGSGNLALATQAALANYCPIIEDTREAVGSTITGIAPFAELANGQMIWMHLAFDSPGSASITLTLSNGTSTGAIPFFGQTPSGGFTRISLGLYKRNHYKLCRYEADNNRWVCVNHDNDTVYYNLTTAEIETGTSTQTKVVSAAVLRNNFYLKSEVDNLCPIIEDTRTSEVATITGVAPFSELRDGQMIVLHLKFSLPNDAQLILTLANGEQTSAAYLYLTQMHLGLARGWGGSVRAGSYIQFVFNTDKGWVIIGQRDTHAVLANITQAEIDAGSSTTARLVTPKLLVDNFEKRTQMVSVDNQSAQVEQALESNKFYKFLNPVDELTLTLVAPTGYGDVMAIYAGKFTASSTWDSLVLPASVSIASGAPTITAGGTYEFNILDNVLMLSEI